MSSVTSSFDSGDSGDSGDITIQDPVVPALHESDSETNLSSNERRASAVSGGALMTYGLFRRSLPLMALGGYLAYRAKTGRCNLYDAVGVSSAQGEQGRMGAFTRSITINRSREDVYRLFKGEDAEFGQERGVVRAETADDGVRRWYLRPIASLPRFEVELIEDRSGESIVWQTPAQSRARLRYEVALDDAARAGATGVRINASWLLPGGGPGAVAGKAMGAILESKLDTMLRQAKQYLETGEIATTEGQPSGRSRAQRISEGAQRLTRKVARLVS